MRHARHKRKRKSQFPLVAYLAAALIFLAAVAQQKQPPATPAIRCTAPRVIDGDTFDCAGTRIRLAGIDAPEMPGHCAAGRKCTAGDPHAARDYLSTLTRTAVSCASIETDKYGRTIARCAVNGGNDLSCAMLDAGHAVRRYGYISCFLR